MTTIIEKECRLCNNDKLLDEFRISKGAKDGHRNECKTCCKLYDSKIKPCFICGEISEIGKGKVYCVKCKGIYKKCTICKDKKKINLFYKNRGKCIECYKIVNEKYHKAYSNSFLGFMKSRLDKCISRAKKRGETKPLAGICTITVNDLIEQFEKQNKKCYHFNVDLVTKPNSHYQASVDRLDNNLGYTKENIVFCCLESNITKTWNVDKIKTIINEINKPIIDINHRLNIELLENESKNKKNKQNKKIINEIIHYWCYTCNNYIINTNFYNTNKCTCINCHNKNDKSNRNTILGHINELFRHAKTNNTDRQNKIRRGTYDFTITYEDLLNLLKEQNGRCNISNIQMNYGSNLEKDWTCSLDRLDPTRGYTLDNIQLVCYEFNCMDNIAIVKYINDGSTGWTKTKFNNILNKLKEKYNT